MYRKLRIKREEYGGKKLNRDWVRGWINIFRFWQWWWSSCSERLLGSSRTAIIEKLGKKPRVVDALSIEEGEDFWKDISSEEKNDKQAEWMKHTEQINVMKKH